MRNVGLILMLVSVVMATAGVLMYGYHLIPESKPEWLFDIATGVVFFLGAGLNKLARP